MPRPTPLKRQTDTALAAAACALYAEIDAVRRVPRPCLIPSDDQWLTARLATLYRQLKPIQAERTRRTRRPD
jgi:hypothetical protein